MPIQEKNLKQIYTISVVLNGIAITIYFGFILRLHYYSRNVLDLTLQRRPSNTLQDKAWLSLFKHN